MQAAGEGMEGGFAQEPHAAYNTLRIYPERGRLERHIGLLCDLVEGLSGEQLVTFGSPFVAAGCSGAFAAAAAAAAQPFAVYLDSAAEPEYLAAFAAAAAAGNGFLQSYVLCSSAVAQGLQHPYKFPLKEVECEKQEQRPVDGMVLCVPESRKEHFQTGFKYYFNEAGEFAYDNLVHVCIMVKNAGPLFEKVLQENLEIMDRWTVLDTGSTDGTQDIVRRVLSGKKGQLVEEPFINFRDSRNRCLELAGQTCKYTLMLDDTYAIRGNLRRFLNLIRGDAFANSYSLLIQSDDSEYYSNRLLKTEEKLRYIYTIHEVVQAERNVTVVIPKEEAWIYDHRAPYMENRTKDRKLYDLKCLFEMLEEEPNNPRHLYYLAQTYSCLEDHEKAAHWFERRALAVGGHRQEAVDAMFELGRLYNFKLGKPWALCEETYKKAYSMDPSRPDSLYFLGIHYYLEGDEKGKESNREANRHIAYTHFKQGFALGYPVHAQFSLKPTLSFHFLPKFLAELCYAEGDWQLGLAAANRFLENAKPTDDSYSVMKDWQAIYGGLVGMGPIATVPRSGVEGGEDAEKPLLVIVADGGWGPWMGRDLVEKGVGGSETWVIETARWIQREGTYKVVVFCRCAGMEGVFEDVEYRPIEGFGKFAASREIQTCIISRYSEYIPVAIAGHTENVYLILHDIGPTGSIIPLSPKLKKIWCLTEWHKGFFLRNFPQCADRTEVWGYGVDLERFRGEGAKIPYSFIYSSFPNRGLLPLLQMWPAIRARWPAATLDAYSDIEGAWVNRVAGEEMAAIRALLVGGLEGVRMHGWVSKAELAAAWRRAEIWLYPCVFAETFCLTALEAQAAGVLVVCPPLAALQDTVGNRGLLVGTGRDVGEARTAEWQAAALQALGEVLDEKRGEGKLQTKKEALVGAGQAWALSRSWESVTKRVVRSVFTPTIVVKPQLDVAGMYNWTHDIPTGTKRVFEEVLQGFVGRGAHILEIGTYAGTSLIGMLERLPDATAVAVDRWKNYDENGLEILSALEERGIEGVFGRNVKAAGMEGRIVARKGDSVDVLLEMIAEGRGGERFDFVYVDGSHKCIDCYTDMTLGWRLLKKGGVMGIDDYLYGEGRVAAGDLLEFPMKGIDWFLEKRKGEYRVLSMGWRVFLEKTRDSSRDIPPIVTPFWAPVPEITRAIEGLCEGFTRVLEVGPGSCPFSKATDFVDMGTVQAAVDPSRILKMDIDSETYRCADDSYDFAYCRHVLEDIQNPDFAFRELARVSRAGYIETPSPLIEVLRGVDDGAAQWRGYVHHRYILWTDRENVLNILPKYPILEKLEFSKAFEERLIGLANRGGIYWNNYYLWDTGRGIAPRCKIHKHGITFDIHRDYQRLLEEAVECSLENTGRMLRRLGLH